MLLPLVSAAFFIMLWLPPAHADAIEILFNFRPPYLVRSGDAVTGLTGSPVDAAFKAAGIPATWVEMPTNRQLALVRDNRSKVCAVGWFKNAERETFARFTVPVYRDKPTRILTRTDTALNTAHRTVDALFANKRLILLVKEGYSYGEFLDRKIAAGNPTVIATVQENVVMAKMIAETRADYMFLAAEEGDELLKRQDLAGKRLVMAELSDMPPGNARYLMCSREVSPDIIERLNTVIRAAD